MLHTSSCIYKTIVTVSAIVQIEGFIGLKFFFMYCFENFLMQCGIQKDKVIQAIDPNVSSFSEF